MGMSAGYYLARSGLKTLMIDAFDPPHTEGSHHGESRLIRHVYSGDLITSRWRFLPRIYGRNWRI